MSQSSQNVSTYLVLESLESGQKYGLEIIESISKRTDGKYAMKKPTLYSALTRLEKKGFLSSTYWSDSEFGGRRHYYALTDAGKDELDRLSPLFENYDFSTEDTSAEDTNEESNTDQPQKSEEQKPLILQQENLFNMTEPSKKEETTNKDDQKEKALDNQIDFFSFENSNTETKPETDFENQFEQLLQAKMNEAKAEMSDSRFLSEDERIESPTNSSAEQQPLTQEQEKQNKLIFDSSEEFRKLSRRKSFSDNQIEMAVEYETEEDEKASEQRREALKESLLSARQNHYEQPQTSPQNKQQEEPKQNEPKQEEKPSVSFVAMSFSSAKQQTKHEDVEEKEPHKDDAVFITSRIEQREIPVQRKIAPVNLDVEIDESNLPAPRRNVSLEPTYKDMMSKLFEHKKESEIAAENTATPKAKVTSEEIEPISDYPSLKKYYAQHDIEFKEHIKGSAHTSHNTAFLSFISSTILFCLSVVSSAILFWIISATGNFYSSTTYYFYLSPAIFLVYLIFTFARWRLLPSKKIELLFSGPVNWAIFILCLVIIFILNVIMGLQADLFGLYLTSILLPAIMMFLIFPANFHITKYLFDRYGK